MADAPTTPLPQPDRPFGVVHVSAVDAGRGASWFAEGWRLFTPAVGAWILIVIVGFILQLVLAIIPVLGSLAGQLLFPVLMGGLMLGCRAVDRGEPLTVPHLFAGFGPKAGALLVVALIYLAAVIAIVLLVVALVFVFFGAAVLAQFASSSLSMGDGGSAALAVLVAFLIFLLLFLPLAMAVWFAPALIVLKGLGPWDAMKLSFQGGIKNIFPFLVYGVLWIGLAIVATIPLLLGWLVLGPVTIASIYASYCDIFEEPAAVTARRL